MEGTSTVDSGFCTSFTWENAKNLASKNFASRGKASARKRKSRTSEINLSGGKPQAGLNDDSPLYQMGIGWALSFEEKGGENGGQLGRTLGPAYFKGKGGRGWKPPSCRKGALLGLKTFTRNSLSIEARRGFGDRGAWSKGTERGGTQG